MFGNRVYLSQNFTMAYKWNFVYLKRYDISKITYHSKRCRYFDQVLHYSLLL